MTSTFIKIQEPSKPLKPPTQSGSGFALWQLGFRPFYLLASGFAALSIALWALQFAGWLGSHAYLKGPLWHAHEMLFGFTLAVVVGFLFTAGRNWSQRPTPTGAALAALAGLWLAGRVLVLTPWAEVAAVVNVAFPLLAAGALWLPFLASRNRRNYFFVGLLLLMAVGEAALHLSLLGWLHLPVWLGLQLGLDVVLFIMAVMAGRVIPMFTNNGVPGAGAARVPWLEKLVLTGTLALLAADLLQLNALALATLAGLVSLAHGARWLLWRPWKTGRVPLVWVLHMAYAWIPVHLLLRALAALSVLPSSAANHALTVGAIGGLTLGMMSRTTLGHTGRLLQASRSDVASYTLVALAAVVRVGWPLLAPSQTVAAVLVSAALWSLAFVLYFWRYAPMLIRPRVDGLAG